MIPFLCLIAKHVHSSSGISLGVKEPLSLRLSLVARPRKGEYRLRLTIRNESDDIVQVDPAALAPAQFMRIVFLDENDKVLEEDRKVGAFAILSQDNPLVLGPGYFYGFDRSFEFSGKRKPSSAFANINYSFAPKKDGLWSGKLQSNVLKLNNSVTEKRIGR